MRPPEPSKRTRCSADATAVALLALCVGCSADGAAPELQPPELASHALRVSGQELRDALNRTVLLRGFGAGGRAKMPPFLPFELRADDFPSQAARYFGALRALGANAVRLVLSWEGLEPQRGTYDAVYWQRFLSMLDAARVHGLFVIVDFHQDVFAAPFCGDGFPLWALGDVPHGEPRYDCGELEWGAQYLGSSGPVAQAFDRLWNNADGLQDDLEAMWRHVAAEVGSHPAVAAFEVINEPARGSIDAQTFAGSTLPRFYERMGRAIQQSAGAAVAVLGGGPAGDPQAKAEHLRAPALEAFVYAPHYYHAGIYLGLQVFSAATVREELTAAVARAKEWGVPAFLGELGAQNSNPKKADYVAFVLDVMDELYLGAAIWEASMAERSWNHEDFSVLDSEGRQQAWAGAAVRAYPRAVAGRVARFSWDRNERALHLEVEEARRGVSEIYLPARHLGVAPEITVQGATWRWLADQELLLLSAAEGAAFVVDVRP